MYTKTAAGTETGTAMPGKRTMLPSITKKNLSQAFYSNVKSKLEDIIARKRNEASKNMVKEGFLTRKTAAQPEKRYAAGGMSKKAIVGVLKSKKFIATVAILLIVSALVYYFKFMKKSGGLGHRRFTEEEYY